MTPFSKQVYGPRWGLEGPFIYPNGRVLYFDLKEGQYWDPQTDFYVDEVEVAAIKQTVFDLLTQ